MSVIHDKIQVVVRIRPPRNSGSNLTTKVNLKTISIKDKIYSFDYIYDIDSTQSSIFQSTIQPLIQQFVFGINTTIFAYGQTGSGKTYTMGTDQTSIHFQDGHCGIIPRFLFHLFDIKNSLPHELSLSIQFLELYNEEIRDLLISKFQTSNIRISDSKQGISLTGLTEKSINSAIEALFYLNEGNKSRTTGFTAMNSESSRSHAIFTVLLTQRKINKETNSMEIIKSKFNFVDLAGSERLQRTKAVGTRAKEGININIGLLALGNVICALTETNLKTKRHVPYRDSKLTRLLEDSLGGNSKCMMIACICPSMENVSETCNTLLYANRVNSIENKISINHKIVSNCDNCINCQKLQDRIVALESELRTLKQRSKNGYEFVTKMNEIIESQKESIVKTYETIYSDIYSMSRLMSMEHDLKLLECIPDNTYQLSMEKMAMLQKIESIKNFSLKTTIHTNSNMPISLELMDAANDATNLNASKIDDFLIANPQGNLLVDPSNSHELRWNYLLNFTCQQLILQNSLHHETIEILQEMLLKNYSMLKTFFQLLNPTQTVMNELITQIKKPNVSPSIPRSNIPQNTLMQLQNTLDRLFPINIPTDHCYLKVNNEEIRHSSHHNKLNHTFEDIVENIDDISSHSNKMDIDEVRSPNVPLKRHQTFNPAMISKKRRRSQGGKISNLGYVNPNRLCLPVINSPNKKPLVTKPLGIQPLRSIFKPLTNQINIKGLKKASPSVNIVENFRRRNLLNRTKQLREIERN